MLDDAASAGRQRRSPARAPAGGRASSCRRPDRAAGDREQQRLDNAPGRSRREVVVRDKPPLAALFPSLVEPRWCAPGVRLKVLDKVEDWSVIDEQIFGDRQV